MHLDSIDLHKLRELHPDLQRLLIYSSENPPLPFRVLEGKRTLERQKLLVERGSSHILDSKHLTGRAVDIAPLEEGKPSWSWPLYYKLAPHIKATATKLQIRVRWGGDWKSFPDGPHWELEEA